VTTAPATPLARILNVDDNEAMRYTTSRALRQAGFDVLEAGTGADAVALTHSAGPDLVLLDVKLPDVSGFDLCRQLKTDPATRLVPIVHITATYASGEHWASALDAGADAYLTHPVEPVVLVATIRGLLRAKAAEGAVRREALLWQSTFDAMADGVCVLDASGSILRCNQSWARRVGVPPVDLVGTPGLPVLPGVARPEEGWPFERARQSLRPEEGEFEVDGGWLSVVAHPILDEAGAIAGVVRVVAEITERKRAERERGELLAREQAARSAAETANRLKDEFLATLSHELRTPLNAIVGWAHVLRGGGLDEAATRRAVEIINRNAQAQSQLISDILDVSRIIAGKLRLNVRAVQPIEVIQAALETVRPAAEARGVAIQCILDPQAGPVSGDPDRLQQVFWNLLSNAIKFAPRGGKVQVRLEGVNSHVEVTVADNGPGVAPEFLPRVFERFAQADSSSTRPHGGLGLGLAIVRHLVEMHGGDVRADNREEDTGAVFVVRLPLRSVAPAPFADEVVHGTAPAEHTMWLESAPSLSGLRVVVVDDDTDSRELMATVLGQCGARVFTAAAAAQGLRLVETELPDVAVADIEMPGEDGYSFIAKLRSLPAARGGMTPTAALTAYAGAGDRVKALRAGFQIHLAKPIQPAELATVVLRLSRGGTAQP
jgi:PAS domain S-box-containing protein